MILLYASPHEVKYIKSIAKVRVGVGAKDLSVLNVNAPWLPSEAVLFGSCGLIAERDTLTENGKLDMLVECGYWHNEEGEAIEMDNPNLSMGITTEKPVHSRFYKSYLRNRGFLICDMETFHVAAVCKETGVKFRSIRYVIDLCDEKVMPMGINWAWREWQHYRMQKIFNEWLKRGLK